MQQPDRIVLRFPFSNDNDRNKGEFNLLVIVAIIVIVDGIARLLKFIN